MLSLAGRATRRAYIVVNLVVAFASAVGDALETRIKGGIDQLSDAAGAIAAILILVVILVVVWIVFLALPVRRLHDTNRSGWYYLLILFVPYLGPIVGFVWLVFVPGTKGRNRFGADPRGPSDGIVTDIFDGPPVASDESAR